MMIQMTSKPYTQESPDTAGVVYIVEDDEAVRDSLKWLLEASSYRVELFESGEMFLAKFDPNMSGLEVQEHLIARKCDIPIIFISGHGDVSMAVSTLKKGAVDFIEKPFDQAALRSLIERMLQEARQRKAKAEQRSLNDALLSKLTPRGRLNKQIAADLGISIKTVEAHRASIMDKTNSGTVADLMRVVMNANRPPVKDSGSMR